MKITEKAKKRANTYFGVDQGCPTFFHNGPNYKLSYSRREAKRSLL